jgi:hypothetical protein
MASIQRHSLNYSMVSGFFCKKMMSDRKFQIWPRRSVPTAIAPGGRQFAGRPDVTRMMSACDLDWTGVAGLTPS